MATQETSFLVFDSSIVMHAMPDGGHEDETGGQDEGDNDLPIEQDDK
ncbi:MAG: hypothetical protein U5K69_13930 [Balneolaceae bacterium]|nr:hypothetical protein [Balneolaceae bacterium]